MWVVRATEIDDLPKLKIQRGQEVWRRQFGEDYTRALTMCGSITGEFDGEPMCIAGIIPRWETCGQAHAIISCNAGRCFRPMIAAIREFLETGHRFRRVEAYVRTSWSEAHRMVRVLGFEREGTMKDFDPLGYDCDLYARTFNWTP